MALRYVDLQTWDGNLDDQETWGSSTDNPFALGSIRLDLQGVVDLATAGISPHSIEGEFTLDPPARLGLVGTLGISGTLTIPAGTPTIVPLGPAELKLLGHMGIDAFVDYEGEAFWQPESEDINTWIPETPLVI